MMTAAHIQPFHPVQIFPEFLFKCLKSRYKIICILFAQRVEMKSFHTLQQIFPELFFCHTKSGSIATRIIDLMPFLRGALRIDADADTDCFFIFSHLCTFPAHFFIFLILCKGIEDDMVADLHQFFHIFFFVCRCKDMIFFSHLFISKSCLIQSARCCSADILTDHRIQAVHGKCFLGEQDVTAALLLKIRKNLQIFSDFAFIHNIARCRQIFPHHSTVCGFSSTTHGSPY